MSGYNKHGNSIVVPFPIEGLTIVGPNKAGLNRGFYTVAELWKSGDFVDNSTHWEYAHNVYITTNSHYAVGVPSCWFVIPNDATTSAWIYENCTIRAFCLGVPG